MMNCFKYCFQIQRLPLHLDESEYDVLRRGLRADKPAATAAAAAATAAAAASSAAAAVAADDDAAATAADDAATANAAAAAADSMPTVATATASCTAAATAVNSARAAAATAAAATAAFAFANAAAATAELIGSSSTVEQADNPYNFDVFPTLMTGRAWQILLSLATAANKSEPCTEPRSLRRIPLYDVVSNI